MRLTWSIALTLAAAIVISSGAAVAQRGGGGGRGGSPGMPGGSFPLSRMESLQENFKLEGDKKKAVKEVLDAAHKSAAPVREALLAAHDALGAAVQGGAAQDAVDAAARAYGAQAAAMTRIEMDAIAKVIAIADPDLQNPQAIQAAFFMARGMFLKSGKWDEIPERNVPGY
jgi:hypothetical protein